jgi:hypothetical protein
MASVVYGFVVIVVIGAFIDHATHSPSSGAQCDSTLGCADQAPAAVGTPPGTGSAPPPVSAAVQPPTAPSAEVTPTPTEIPTDTPTPDDHGATMGSFDMTYTRGPVNVGDPVKLTVTLINLHRNLQDFAIHFSSNDWISNHVIQETSPSYKIKDVLGEKFMEFGYVRAGQTATFTILAVAKSAGNFDYTIHLDDFEGSGGSDLQYPSDPHGNNEAVFSETVNP